jgi:glycine oxidase
MTLGKDSYDILLIGGGVIGLSLAWELAQRGERVCVVDRGEMGKDASWAGAGMIPAGPDRSHWPLATPFEQLAGLSQRLYPDWCDRLRDLTDNDSQYQACGALYLADNPTQAVDLQRKADRWKQLGIPCEAVDAQQVTELEPAIERNVCSLGGFHVPGESQLRNPRHLRGLIAACELQGVELLPYVAVEQFDSSGGRLIAARTSEGPIYADRFCITAGCWTGQLGESLGLDLPIRPIRGQILQLDGEPGLMRGIIWQGMNYFTPRLDGRLLVGSTLENVGFNKETTDSAISNLRRFANSLVPATAQLSERHRWAGLRPGTADDLPYLGRIPQLHNAWLAAGHYRSGLQLAPATAVVMRFLLQGEEPPIDVSPLGVERSSD